MCQDKHENGEDEFMEYFPESMMCAGYPGGGKDVCNGDSGGPLMCDVDGQPVVFGVTSFGNDKCDDPAYPNVWARVSDHLDFIIKYMD